MPPEFSLMPRFKSTNFYQNKPKLRYFQPKQAKFSSAGGSASQPPNGLRRMEAELPDAQNSPSHFRFLVTRRILNVCYSYFQDLESYNEKLLS